MNRVARSKLAAETLRILDAGGYTSPGGHWVSIADSLKECIENTQLFVPDDLTLIRDQICSCTKHEESNTTELTVENETSLAGARSLHQAGNNRWVGVLNFASARNPGGGFLGGSQAQEESLACRSGLYKSLLQCPEYYHYHRTNPNLLYSHRVIVSPRCPVFRDDRGDLLAESYPIDFITCPAPNAGAHLRRFPKATEEIVAVLRERALLVLCVALHFGLTELVLGAWGCGVFGNDPLHVAKAFRDALASPGLSNRFHAIRFSVLDCSRAGANYRAFMDVFFG